MSEKILKGVALCRRDNDYNYEKVKDTFVPKKGEICLVDTASSGLLTKVGDGVSAYSQLQYTNEVFVKAYYSDGLFYVDETHNKLVSNNVNQIYIDLHKPNNIYYWEGRQYVLIGAGDLPVASSSISGVLKLYDVVGQNTDGTMTQKAITDELDTKVEMDVNPEEELIIFK